MNQRALAVTLRTEIDRAQRGHAPSRARAVRTLMDNPTLLGSKHVARSLGKARVRDLLFFVQQAQEGTDGSLADFDLGAVWDLLEE